MSHLSVVNGGGEAATDLVAPGCDCAPGAKVPCAGCVLGPIYDELQAEQGERDRETVRRTLIDLAEVCRGVCMREMRVEAKRADGALREANWSKRLDALETRIRELRQL